jgi:outer membrane protein assembly factor BamB
MSRTCVGLGLCVALISTGSFSQSLEQSSIPNEPLVFGAFLATFSPDGSFEITGEGWPPMKGRYEVSGSEIELLSQTEETEEGCDQPGRFTYRAEAGHLELELIEDPCQMRGMVLNNSDWRPVDEEIVVPERRIVLTSADSVIEIPSMSTSEGSWPSFRGPAASGVADGMNLPPTWNGETGENILWRTDVPGLGHSSPIVWGDQVYVTSAVSSAADATFRPGLYGDGDASQDRSVHRFELTALDRKTGKVLWTRIATEGEPIGKRHIKATYANPSPATDGRIVVASFGSQGVFAYDVNGQFLWRVDLGHLDLGAYDVPSYEWGSASSPILWNGMLFLQCDTQSDSFLLALEAETGETIWKAARDELPTWGTPTVVGVESGPELVTNGSNFIRGYDPKTGEELWRLGRSSKITAPTPIFSDSLIVVASGRGPERPIFVIRLGACGDLTLPVGKTSSDSIAWSIERRGPYMPTPLIYDGRLYVLNNNGAFAGYELATGKELFRVRAAHGGSGFSGSPVAADGKIYLPSEDGDILVVAAGREYEHLETNPMGELLMASPALSDGVMYVRSESSLFAIGSGDNGP